MKIYYSIFFINMALCSKTTKKPHASTGPLARRFVSLLAPFTHLLATHCLQRSRVLMIPSLTRSLPHSRTRKKEGFAHDMNSSIS